jgi:hypothetical protein
MFLLFRCVAVLVVFICCISCTLLGGRPSLLFEDGQLDRNMYCANLQRRLDGWRTAEFASRLKNLTRNQLLTNIHTCILELSVISSSRTRTLLNISLIWYVTNYCSAVNMIVTWRKGCKQLLKSFAENVSCLKHWNMSSFLRRILQKLQMPFNFVVILRQVPCNFSKFHSFVVYVCCGLLLMVSIMYVFLVCLLSFSS